jgi:Terminase large subunit, T4likevirus-type, N-terminal
MYRPPPSLERPPAVEIMRLLNLEPDPWQIEVLQSTEPNVLLNCSRQSGKTTVAAILALVEALYRPLAKVLVFSRTHRQAKEIIGLISFFQLLLKDRLLKRRNQAEINFTHFSRIISLPCNEQTIRGYSQVDLIILDEAARLPDDLYRAVRPMLAVSQGRLFCLSTPHGRRGFFWEAWAQGGDDWRRFEVPATWIPRIAPAFLEKERRALGESYFRQEYFCSFEALEGLVYRDFAKCVVPQTDRQWSVVSGQWQEYLRLWERKHGRAAVGARTLGSSKPEEAMTTDYGPLTTDYFNCVGGIDFGYRNPFAAIWGFVDRDDVLWLVGEHYQRERPLNWHAARLPRPVTWYADPAGANEIAELRCADFVVRRGDNALEHGIAAVHARLADGALRVLEGRCPNLLAEAGRYRFGDSAAERGSETPIDAHNHALGALRYLITRLDKHKMVRPLEWSPGDAAA